jgi:hypothetical protein
MSEVINYNSTTKILISFSITTGLVSLISVAPQFYIKHKYINFIYIISSVSYLTLIMLLYAYLLKIRDIELKKEETMPKQSDKTKFLSSKMNEASSISFVFGVISIVIACILFIPSIISLVNKFKK